MGRYMKKVDLTRKVMNRVVGFEKKGIGFWLFRFFLVLTVLVEIVFLSLWFFAKNILESKTYELFSLLTEDREIIEQFWQDTLMIIWEEMPKHLLFIFILSTILIVLILFILRKKIKVIRKKVRLLAKYKGK